MRDKPASAEWVWVELFQRPRYRRSNFQRQVTTCGRRLVGFDPFAHGVLGIPGRTCS